MLFTASKDVDGISLASLASVFTDATRWASPLHGGRRASTFSTSIRIPLAGKHVVVIGRSLVVGKPVSMMLLRRNASVTICHSRTENLPEL